MRSRICLLSSIVVALAAFFVSSAWTQGGFSGPGRYIIENAASGKVVQINPESGLNVTQAAADGGLHQQWDIDKAHAGYYFIRNAMNRRALEVNAESLQDGMPVTSGALTGKRNQQWRIESTKDTNAQIVSAFDKALDIPRSTAATTSIIQLYRTHGEKNQQFIFKRVANNQRRPSTEPPSKNLK